MTKVVDALEASNEPDRAWRVQYLAALAMAYDDAGQVAQVSFIMGNVMMILVVVM